MRRHGMETQEEALGIDEENTGALHLGDVVDEARKEPLLYVWCGETQVRRRVLFCKKSQLTTLGVWSRMPRGTAVVPLGRKIQCTV